MTTRSQIFSNRKLRFVLFLNMFYLAQFWSCLFLSARVMALRRSGVTFVWHWVNQVLLQKKKNPEAVHIWIMFLYPFYVLRLNCDIYFFGSTVENVFYAVHMRDWLIYTKVFFSLLRTNHSCCCCKPLKHIQSYKIRNASIKLWPCWDCVVRLQWKWQNEVCFTSMNTEIAWYFTQLNI